MATGSSFTCLVGILDEKIEHSTQTSWEINKIGGKPDWMHINTPHPRCDACQSLLTLVTQLYCPLEGSLYHRTIYVFICLTPQCHQHSYSFRVYRAQRLDESSTTNNVKAAAPVQAPVNDAMTFDIDWCDEADDWGDEDDELDVMSQLGVVKEKTYAAAALKCLNHVATPEASCTTNTSSDSNNLEQGLEQLNLGPSCDSSSAHQEAPSPRQPVCAWTHVAKSATESGVIDDAVQFCPYYIDVFDEPSRMNDEMLSHERQLMKEYQEREGVSLTEWQQGVSTMSASGGDGGGGEGYEKVTAKHGDRTFQKFVKKTQPCPEQCVRYSYDGKPLWMTDPAKQSSHIPSCTYCGHKRLYEFQLMPALLPSLQFSSGTTPPIDFGVVVVYTCSQSCWPEDGSEMLREESLVVQRDPDSNVIVNAQQKLAQIHQNQRS